jgi:glutamate dehydrogenase/leucine dehydrogenase
VTTRKLTTTDAFVVRDLDNAPAAGIVRLAPKLLVDGATWLARSQTYQFAAFGRKLSGASAGINAPAETRSEAIAAFVAEIVADASAEGSDPLMLEAARGLGDKEILELRPHDPRPESWWESRKMLRTAGVAAAAGLVLDTVDDRSVAIEGFDASGPALVSDLVSRGARITSISTATGTISNDSGFDPVALADAWATHGAAFVAELGEVDTADAVLRSPVGVLIAGSKVGVIGDGAAAGVQARFVVPDGALPVTAKALAMLGRLGVMVLPDFVTTGGHLAAWPDETGAVAPDAAAAAALVEAVLRQVLDHPLGPLLGACESAEEFLLTWRDTLPFGRPIA